MSTNAVAGSASFPPQDNVSVESASGSVTRASGMTEAALREGLQSVLPAALVEAVPDASEAVDDLPGHHGGLASTATSLAASLGSTAAASVASALDSWLARRSAAGARWPGWLRPAFRSDVVPDVVTLTRFSQQRSQYVRKVIDGSPVLLTRHGTVVAAVVPLEPGVYEEEVYGEGFRQVDRKAEDRRAALVEEWAANEKAAAAEVTDAAGVAETVAVDQTAVSHPSAQPERTEVVTREPAVGAELLIED